MALEIEMRWSAAHEDDKDWFAPIVGDTISLLNIWAEQDGNQTRAVATAVAAYFDDEAEWEEHFGAEATTFTVLVEVHGPPILAGKYSVDLERVVQARACRLEPVD